MRALKLFVFSVVVGVVACSGSADSGKPIHANELVRLLPDDHAIMSKVYDSLYQVPDSFYVDERASTPRSYAVYHVKDISISYERCTDDYSEALDWEAADNESRSVGGYYVGSIENFRYFEFVRELAYTDSVGNINDLTSPGYARVFKCGYVNRDGVDRNVLDGYAGTLVTRPLSIGTMRSFSEYMWQFAFFPAAKKAVLETFSAEQTNSYQHTLVLAFLTHQGTGKCDLIEVFDWIFTVNKTDGTMTKEFRSLHRFETRLIYGVPEKCGE